MTSPANQQTPNLATSTSATPAASYASAAGAPNKSVPAPHPAVVVGSSAASAQNARAAPSSSSLNGTTVGPAAVPAVARTTSTINGSADHARKSSVTMAANGPGGFIGNGASLASAKSAIRFGYDSPAMAHSTPSTGHSAPIPIPGGNQRVPSPAHSPSPIPQPSASGGRPPANLQQSGGQMTFGSLNSEGDRHMAQGSLPSNPNILGSQPGTHFRRESNHSIHSEAPGGPNRGNFNPARQQNRNYNPHANQFSNTLGYPPGGSNYRPGGQPQGRNIPPAFQPQPRNMPFPSSPQPNRSPALVPSMPGTPNMPPASMQPTMNIPGGQYYHAPQIPHSAQVQPPFPAIVSSNRNYTRHHKNAKGRREHDSPMSIGGLSPDIEMYPGFASQPQRPLSQRLDRWREQNRSSLRRFSIVEDPNTETPINEARTSSQTPNRIPSQIPSPSLNIQTLNLPAPRPYSSDSSGPSTSSIDLSPENGGFEYWLTMRNQNYGFPPPHLDQYGRPVPYGNYPAVPFMTPAQQAGSGPYNPAQFVQTPYQPQGMVRTPSLPERPSSASQPSQPVICQSNPQAQASQPKPSNSFVKPRRSAAIQIKNAAGEVVDTSSFKQPVSPAPSSQQTKSPPAASTPTPPHKPSTPAHARSESQATPKTAKEIQDELKAKIKQATQAANEKPKEEEEEKKKEVEVEVVHEEEAPKPSAQPEAAPAPAVEEQKEPETKPEEQQQEQQAPVEVKIESEEAKHAAVVEEQTAEPAAAEPAAEPAAEVPEIVKVEEPQKAVEEEKPPAGNAQDEEDEIERMIREMEEADAKREQEEEEHRKKKEAEKAAAKKSEEENRKKNAEEEDRKLREQEREMERLEEEKERRQKEAESSGKTLSVAAALAQARGGDTGSKEDSSPSNVESVTDKLADMSVGDKSDAASKDKPKPAALTLAPINTKPVEPPQPSAALQSLQSARFLTVMDQDIYPAGIKSPNPALNAAVTSKGRHYKYDAGFLLQFKGVFTDQPNIQFSQTVKNLIGENDGGRSASRGQTPTARQGSRGAGGFPGGAFGGVPGRTLPPGTTSMERMAIASGALPRPQVNPMASFQRPGGAFPGATPMSRTSSQNLRNMPHSPRANSRSTRGSRRNDINAKELQAAKTMPLTAGQDVKPIAISATGWKASSLGPKVGGQPGAAPGQNPDYMDPEMVQRKVKAALNKMTPEKFDKISDQILVIASQSKDESDGRTLRQVIQLTFEKATDEAHWASMYAKFCKRMLETMSPEIRDERIKDKNGNIVSGGNLFRKYLLNRCQEEFERGWSTHLPEPKEAEEGEAESKGKKAPGDAAMLTDEYYVAAAAKRRGLGLVQFIGELYKLEMLTERIMHECVQKLVDYKGMPDEAEIESLCKLLRTIGANLDRSEKGRQFMDAYFQRIHTMAALPELQSRMKFMLMDVIDLRSSRWISKETNKGPKTLDEVRLEAEAQQALKAQEALKSNQRGPGGRPPAGRGDVRNFPAGYGQQTSNQVAMDDLRRLKTAVTRASSQNVTLGPTSMFASRSNSGRRLGPGGSLGRQGDDSNPSSRAGTPAPTSYNTFSLLASTDDHHPGSPPSAGPSPLMAKAVPANDKKDNE